MSKATLLQGDCLELMNRIPDSSIDMVLSDLPYGTTRCRWDTPINLQELWDSRDFHPHCGASAVW